MYRVELGEGLYDLLAPFSIAKKVNVADRLRAAPQRSGDFDASYAGQLQNLLRHRLGKRKGNAQWRSTTAAFKKGDPLGDLLGAHGSESRQPRQVTRRDHLLEVIEALHVELVMHEGDLFGAHAGNLEQRRQPFR